MRSTRMAGNVGRPARICREDIADAALAIGLDTFTLALIGQMLGVDHSSLYRHVKGRDDILFLAVDRAIASLNWEPEQPASWPSYLEYIAESVWTLYERYPGLASTIRMMENTPPAIVKAFSHACHRLIDFGFCEEDAALIMDSIMDMTCDSASLWQRMSQQGENGKTIAENISRSWSDAKDDDTTSQVTLVQNIIMGSAKHWWRKKLVLLIHGAAAYAPDSDKHQV
ncbi:MAG: hypothetical protein CENE_00275 [Candidatus Celerinatantimonas neptuna]|nr:MAG: hypothetical protein CENE_00275 [Candidatus Celerinatantimonas neptuna]